MIRRIALPAAVYCEFVGTSRKLRGYLEVQPLGGGTPQLVIPAD